MILKWHILFLLLLVLPLKDAVAMKQDYCAQGDGSTVLLLVDRTSTFDEQDKINFANGIDAMFKQLQTGERLIIHTLTGDFAGSKKIFDACRPGCMEQGLVLGLFSQCRGSRAMVDERKYIRDILTSVKPMISKQEKYPNSEIIETIAFMMQEYEQRKPARLIIFSDMIEYSRLAKFNHLKEKNIPVLLDTLDSIGLIKPMQGVEVEVFGFGRDHSAQRTGLKAEQKHNIEQFWHAYFKRTQATRFHLGRELNF